MKNRAALIRYYEWQVDEHRKALADLFAVAEDLERQEERLNVSASLEQVKAAESEVGQAMYPAFAQGVIARRANIEQSRAELEPHIDSAKEALQLAFQELKKIEIMEDRRKAKVAKEEAYRERVALDEVAQTRHFANKG
jgi:flagellar protein FliJ